MPTVEIEADIPESRRVTVTLPPGTPTGRVRLSVTVGTAWVTTVTHVRPADPAEAAEFDAFLRMQPALRPSLGGAYVAVSGGAVVASGVYVDEVLRRGRQAAGPGAAVYCGWVEPTDGYVFRAGNRVAAGPATS